MLFYILNENDALTSWYAITASFIIWCTYYFIWRKVLIKKSPEYVSRVVAGTHGIIIAFLGCKECFTNWTFSNPNQSSTTRQSFILLTSLGYFLEDTAWCFYYGTETPLMMAHHVYSCFAIYRLLQMKTAGGQATCGLGVLEATNPFLQMRWFVRSHGYQGTILFYSAEFTFIFLFFILRMILGTFYLVTIFLEPKNTWEFRILMGAIYVISWMFVINIMKYLEHKYFPTGNTSPHIERETLRI